MILLAALFIKHFVADFLYQPSWQFMNKGTYRHWGGLVHSAQHVFLTALVLLLTPASFLVIAGVCLVEFLVHYHTDWAKMNINRHYGWSANTHNEFWILLGVDQLIHSLTYVGIVAYLI